MSQANDGGPAFPQPMIWVPARQNMTVCPRCRGEGRVETTPRWSAALGGYVTLFEDCHECTPPVRFGDGTAQTIDPPALQGV